jgi:putative membrane protein
MAEPPQDVAPDVIQRTSMAAERTWLAWWRTALAATVGALGVGRLAPDLLGVEAWPYVLLGAGYGVMAVGLLLVGAKRQRDLERGVTSGAQEPLSFRLVIVFTIGGIMLSVLTVVLVVAQT